MIGSVRNWVGSASHLWSRPMGVGVLPAVAAFSKLAGRLSTRLNETQVQDHLRTIQLPRVGLSESQLQSHPV